MTGKEFYSTLDQAMPPQGANIFLKALWYEANGNWNEAHDLVQDEEGMAGAWIHAYLHRKEGDLSNAGYWYRKANKKVPNVSLQQEWKDLVEEFLKQI